VYVFCAITGGLCEVHGGQSDALVGSLCFCTFAVLITSGLCLTWNLAGCRDLKVLGFLLRQSECISNHGSVCFVW
jgi:hypothetical protein